MSPADGPNARREGLSRIALVGGTSPVGSLIKDRLFAAGYPGSAVSLLALEEATGTFTDYGDEARVLVAAAEDDLRSEPLVCFCSGPSIARRFTPVVVDAGGIVLDCTGAWADDPDSILAHPISGAEPASVAGGATIAVPSPPAVMLAQLLGALGPLADRSVATVLLPGSAAGMEGAEALARQAAAVLNFEDTETDVFGRRLAFDSWPANGKAEPAPPRASEQLGRMGLTPPAMALLWTSTLHAVGATIHLPVADPDEVAAALDKGGIPVGGPNPDGGTIDSPRRATGRPGLRAGELHADGAGGTWLWMLQDNHHGIADTVMAVLQRLLAKPETEGA